PGRRAPNGRAGRRPRCTRRATSSAGGARARAGAAELGQRAAYGRASTRAVSSPGSFQLLASPNPIPTPVPDELDPTGSLAQRSRAFDGDLSSFRVRDRVRSLLPYGLGRIHELQVVQLAVVAVHRQQLLVRTLLDDPPAYQDDDAVGVADGRQSM